MSNKVITFLDISSNIPFLTIEFPRCLFFNDFDIR